MMAVFFWVFSCYDPVSEKKKSSECLSYGILANASDEESVRKTLLSLWYYHGCEGVNDE